MQRHVAMEDCIMNGFEFNKAVILEQAQVFNSFYVYDEAVILANMAALSGNFAGVEFLYSLKTNPHSNVLNTVLGGGFGGDAASLNEVKMCVANGVPKAKIQYSAPGKSMYDIEEAIEVSTLVADSLGEVLRINEVAKSKGLVAEIGVRINPNFTFYGDEGMAAKFGIDEEQAVAAVGEWLALSNVKIVGLHVHSKSQELDGGVLLGYYEKMFKLAEKFQGLFGYELEFLNMGSGIGINYEVADAPLDLVELGAKVGAMVADFGVKFPKMQVYIETGRYVVGKSGVYCTKVLDKKVSHGKTFVILANTLNGFVRPSLGKMVTSYKADAIPCEPLYTSATAFQFVALVENDQFEVVNLVGNLCTGADIIASDVQLPTLEVGDVVVMSNAGSYAAVLSPMQFSSQIPPAQLFLTVGGEVLVG